MRALAHPVRMALMEELTVADELTATQAASLVGESPANCSFHLRQLAKYGFVEESNNGHGRNRPWRLINHSLELNREQVEGEPAAEVALTSLTRMFQERAVDRLRQWWRTEAAFPRRWRRAAQSKQTVWWVTPEELEELGAELLALLHRYHERIEDPTQRPAGAAPVEFLAFAYPLVMPAVPQTAETGDPEGES
jgi:predicted ArsR family transcriptional regulator